MAITAVQLAEIREFIGTSEPPSDATLEEYFDELGTVTAVARRVVRQRLAALRAKAAKFTADGDYSEDWSENIRALERLEGRLGGGVAVGVFVRDGRQR